MQIRASRRQVRGQGLRPHKVLAQHWARQRRLVTGGALALVTSVLAWLLGVPLAVHLGLVTIGFAAGFCWRFTRVGRRAEQWAFSWIEARAGLAYLTAHELAEAEDEAVPGGFSAAVQARAAQVGRLETPSLQPWALPLIVLALALAALPHLVLPNLRAPLAPLTQRLPKALPDTSVFKPPTATTNTPNTPNPTADPGATPKAKSTPDTNAASPAGDTATDPNTGQSFGTSAAPGSNAAEGEKAALARFLEQSGAAQAGTQSAAQSGAARPGAAQPSAPQARALQAGTADNRAGRSTSRSETRQGSQTGSGSPSEAQASQQPPDNATTTKSQASKSPVGREGSSAQNPDQTSEDPAQNSNQPGQSSNQAGSGQPQTASVPGDTGKDGGQTTKQTTGQARANQNAATPPEPGMTPQAASEANSQSNQGAAPRSDVGRQSSDASKPQAGASSERAGTRSGNALPSSRERLGGSPNAPVRVLGTQKDGPVSFAGEALQPGKAPATLPQTGSAAYRRAAEEVIREGRIPLEYQNIVRDYFR